MGTSPHACTYDTSWMNDEGGILYGRKGDSALVIAPPSCASGTAGPMSTATQSTKFFPRTWQTVGNGGAAKPEAKAHLRYARSVTEFFASKNGQRREDLL